MNWLEAEKYNDQYAIINEQFRMLPGHRHVILGVVNDICTYFEEKANEAKTEELASVQIENHRSIILNELITSSNANDKINPQARRYSQIISAFFTYIFLLCGRLCYDTLSKNLPIPSTTTISEF